MSVMCVMCAAGGRGGRTQEEECTMLTTTLGPRRGRNQRWRTFGRSNNGSSRRRAPCRYTHTHAHAHAHTHTDSPVLCVFRRGISRCSRGSSTQARAQVALLLLLLVEEEEEEWRRLMMGWDLWEMAGVSVCVSVYF